MRLFTLVKGHQANTVRHLIKDAKSLAAIDAAIAFGKGKINKEKLEKAADEAKTVYAPFAAFAAFAANSYAAFAVDTFAYDSAYEETYQRETADIFRKFISIEKFNVNQ